MKNNDKIKAALNKDVPTWDENALWDKIENQLPEEKKNRKGIWMLFFGLLVLLGGWGIGAFEHSNIQTGEEAKGRAFEQSNIQTGEQVKGASGLARDLADTNVPLDASGPARDLADTNVPLDASGLAREYSDTNVAIDTSGRARDLADTNVPLDALGPSLSPKASAGKHALMLHEKIAADSENSDPINKVTNLTKAQNAIKITTGIFNTSRSLSSTTDTEWIDAKQQTESLHESMDYQIAYEKRILRNLYLSAGVGFRQSIEISTFRDSLVNDRMIDSDSAIIVNTLTGSHYFSGKIEEKTTQGRTTITPNKYRRLYLPLRLAYQVQKNKSSLQFGIGLNIELLSNFKGAALDFDMQRTKDTEQIASIYKNKVEISELSFDLSYAYALNKKLNLVAGLGYLHGIKNHLNHDAYNLKYRHLGLRLGVSCLY